MWFRERRRVKARRQHLAEVADRIGARTGLVLKESHTGGAGIGNSPVSMGIITLRPGSPDEVAQAQIDAAVRAGYVRPPTPPCGKRVGCLFHGQPDLPMLSIVTYAPGERSSAFQPVPDGHTVVIISLA
ncbi:hypothetical protein [Lentzea sp. NPDC003310]|uniref:hypothetical protein n=1 Tax=Lentzea sp. NPDC003310 TaxID=3154447 RepID=UPI0033B2D603